LALADTLIEAAEIDGTEQARTMKCPDLPANEKQRLQALHALKLLDTKANERYDRLTRMAGRAFSVPLSMLSLVDQNRQ
jgi:hypothetical protein